MYVVYWQMHSGMDVRAWQDYDTSPDLQQLKAHIEKVAVPCYMQSLGLPPQAAGTRSPPGCAPADDMTKISVNSHTKSVT